LKAAAKSAEAVVLEIQRVTQEIQISMFAAGAKDLQSLGKIQLLKG
jgi:isopentenyl diphosphate isomerase/L-lactate dehydrogenase-like FMN-dependent dehydrogenase